MNENFQISQTLSQVVFCDHNSRTRCLSCIGRHLSHVKDAKMVCSFIESVYKDIQIDWCRQFGNGTLAYGEVMFWSFLEIIVKTCSLPENKIFYDLGSGTGRAVAQAAMCFSFSKCIGIEIVPQLYEISLKKMKILQSIQSIKSGSVDFLCADIFEIDWSDADIIFISSTICFPHDMLVRLAKIAERLKSSSSVITLSVPLSSTMFKVVHSAKYRMSWGNVTVFIQIKL